MFWVTFFTHLSIAGVILVVFRKKGFIAIKCILKQMLYKRMVYNGEHDGYKQNKHKWQKLATHKTHWKKKKKKKQ